VITNAPGNGSSKNVTVVKGGTTAGITLANEQLANYTLCYVARYAGANRGRLLDAFTENWMSGFYNATTDLAYHNNWTANARGTSNTNWLYACDSVNDYISNTGSRSVVASNITYLPARLTINNYNGTGSESMTQLYPIAR
jgi:hypothetical protein